MQAPVRCLISLVPRVGHVAQERCSHQGVCKMDPKITAGPIASALNPYTPPPLGMAPYPHRDRHTAHRSLPFSSTRPFTSTHVDTHSVGE
jgi:hypothetical protein